LTIQQNLAAGLGTAPGWSLVPVRILADKHAPAVVQPYRNDLWATTRKLRRCELWALPDDVPNIGDVFAWLPLFRKRVGLWPIDVSSAAIMTIFVQAFLRDWSDRERSTFDALRWCWGHPFGAELGLPAPSFETIWPREGEL
jgi:hypothetical protein